MENGSEEEDCKLGTEADCIVAVEDCNYALDSDPVYKIKIISMKLFIELSKARWWVWI